MEAVELVKYKADQANEIVYGSANMTGREKLLYYLAVVNLTRHSDAFPTLRVPAKQLAEFLGIEGEGYYSQLQLTCKKLLTRVVEIDDEISWTAFQYVSRCKYIKSEGMIEICLHEELRPFLLDLKGSFASIPFLDIAHMNGGHAIGLYEFLYHLRRESGVKQRRVTVEVDRLKRKLGVEKKKSYVDNSAFQRIVLQTAITEINKESPVDIKLTPIRGTGRGNPIVAFEFGFIDKSNWHRSDKLPPATEQMMLQLLDATTPRQADMVVKKTITTMMDRDAMEVHNRRWAAEGLSRDEINTCSRWANKDIQRRAKTRIPVENPVGHVIWAINNRKGL
jgi:plasmid replication initiation protein